MTYRVFYLLAALACVLPGAGLAAVVYSDSRAPLVDLVGPRIPAGLLLLALVWAIFFLVRAFVEPSDHPGWSCLRCGRRASHLSAPVFADRFRCPACQGAVVKTGSWSQRAAAAPPSPRFPPLEFEVAPADGQPGRPVPVAALQAALVQSDEYALEDDGAGRPLLVGEGGIYRARANAETGDLELALERETIVVHVPVGAEVRPEEVIVRGNSMRLAVACCRALPRALGPIKVRVWGAENWVTVDGGSQEWSEQLQRDRVTRALAR